MQYGYALSHEEHDPRTLVANARRAEDAGFDFLMLSDHFHPWTDTQGQSPFVWSTLGAVSQVTRRVRVGTGVTCPILRTHPVIVAQAAATTAAMFEGRFFLGVGTGENLNEHVVGMGWPSVSERRAMLEEAIDIMTTMWSGDLVEYDGDYYTVQQARIYTLPDEPPPIYVAASGNASAEFAGETGDGLIATAPKRELVQRFEGAGGSGKAKLGQTSVCWAASEDEARRIAHKHWPNAAIPGELSAELPLPRHFEQAAKLVTEEAIAQEVVCGPDPERHIEKLREYEQAGFDHVYVHTIGPDQEGSIRFYEREVLPQLRGMEQRRTA
jgi:G6PDH family F420-dependent oxidoreductase